jgi:hypothetical protein
MSFVYSKKLTPFTLSLAMDDEMNPAAEVVLVASNIPYPTISAAPTWRSVAYENPARYIRIVPSINLFIDVLPKFDSA